MSNGFKLMMISDSYIAVESVDLMVAPVRDYCTPTVRSTDAVTI